MTETIRSRILPSQLVLSKRFTTTMATIATDIPAAYQMLWKLLADQQNLIDGLSFNLYHCTEFDPDHIDVETCIPLKREIDTPPGTGMRMIPSQKMALSTLHKGPYQGLATAYRRLADYAKAHYFKPSVPTYEIYQKWAPNLSPKEFVTEVVWPVEL